MSIERRRVVTAVGMVAAWVLLLGGCGGPRSTTPKTDPRFEFDRGRLDYEHGRYVESQAHLKRFLDLSPGHAQADSAQLLIGLSLFKAKSFAEAAVEFGILGREYPRSPLLDEAAYYECYSYFKQMRSAQLDPTFATRSQSCLNDFLLRYPQTKLRPEAEARLAEINDLLAEKEYRLGVLFAKMKRPEAATVYLQGLLENYPTSRWAAPAQLWIGRSHEERLEWPEAAASFRALIAAFPKDPASREAQARLDKLLARHPELKAEAPAPASPSPPP